MSETFEEYFRKTWVSSGAFENFDTSVERSVWDYQEAKLQAEREKVTKLEKDIEEIIELGTDQVVTERFQAEREKVALLLSEFKVAKMFLGNAVDKSVLEFINQGKRMDKVIKELERGE